METKPTTPIGTAIHQDTSQQPLPFGINRIVLLVIFSILNFLCGWAFFNWASVSLLLFEDGAYLWTCAKDTAGAFINDLRKIGKPFVCDQQDVSVQFLFLMQTIGHIVVSPFIGIGTDHLGIRITIFIGMVLLLIGVVLLALSSQAFPAYAISCFIIGAAGDTLFVPTMRLSRTFPRNSSFVSALLGSTVSASPAIATILHLIKKAVHWSTKNILLAYASIIVLPMTVIAFIFSPNFLYSNEEIAKRADQTNVAEDCELTEQVDASSKRSDKNDDTFLNNLFSVGTIYILLFASGYSAVVMLYQCSAARQLHDGSRYILELLLPFSWIPCLLYGRFTDKFGVEWSLLLVNLTGILATLTFISTNIYIQYMSAIFFTVYVSFLDVACYCFCERVVNPQHMGKVYGIVIGISGIVSIVSYQVYEFLIVKFFKGEIHQTFLGLIGLLCLLNIPLVHLIFSIKKWSRDTKQ